MLLFVGARSAEAEGLGCWAEAATKPPDPPSSVERGLGDTGRRVTEKGSGRRKGRRRAEAEGYPFVGFFPVFSLKSYFNRVTLSLLAGAPRPLFSLPRASPHPGPPRSPPLASPSPAQAHPRPRPLRATGRTGVGAPFIRPVHPPPRPSTQDSAAHERPSRTEVPVPDPPLRSPTLQSGQDPRRSGRCEGWRWPRDPSEGRSQRGSRATLRR